MKSCLICQGIINDNFEIEWILSLQPRKIKLICQDCQGGFRALSGKIKCEGCSRVLEISGFCNDCKKWIKKYNGKLLKNTALYEYNEKMKDYFQKFKFLGDYYFLNVFNHELRKFVQKEYGSNWLYVPIPISIKSYQERMFNQVEGLFSGVNFTRALIVQSEEKKQQSKLNRNERLRRKQPFKLNSQYEEIVKDKNILLLDDIYTTGRTLYFAAEVLKNAGVKKIETITLAR